MISNDNRVKKSRAEGSSVYSEVYKFLFNSRSANLWQDFYVRTSVKDTVAYGYSLSLFLQTIKVSYIPLLRGRSPFRFFRPIFHSRSFFRQSLRGNVEHVFVVRICNNRVCLGNGEISPGDI